MAKEIPFLSTNLISVAYYLDQFVCCLTRVYSSRMPLKQSQAASEPGTLPGLRQGVAILFTNEFLDSIDFSNERFDGDFMHHT